MSILFYLMTQKLLRNYKKTKTLKQIDIWSLSAYSNKSYSQKEELITSLHVKNSVRQFKEIEYTCHHFSKLYLEGLKIGINIVRLVICENFDLFQILKTQANV